MKRMRRIMLMAVAILGTFVISSCQKQDYISPAQIEEALPIGALPGIFEVGNGHKVHFSIGDLQYCYEGTHNTLEGENIGTWRFATELMDNSETGNEANSEFDTNQNVCTNVFHPGTSGYNGFQPYLTANQLAERQIGITRNDPWYDWGIYNAIANGGNRANTWRTLNQEEWEYLFYHYRWGIVEIAIGDTLGTCKGLAFLPAEFEIPDGLTFKTSMHNNSINHYSTQEWHQMETAGAVLLPGFSYWCGCEMVDPTEQYYWNRNDNWPSFEKTGNHTQRRHVRLVHDIQ